MFSFPRRASTVLAAAVVIASLGATGAAVAAPHSPTSVAAAKGAKVMRGPDVSDYQHPAGAAIRWGKVRKAGASFAIVKASEGSSYINPYFTKDYAGAAAAGLVHGSYHFARPALPITSTARAQAKLFAGEIGDVATTGTLPPALDLETTGGLSQAQLIRWAQTFLLEMRDLTGRTPMLYTYPSFWGYTLNDPAAFRRYPIWMAAYSAEQPTGATLWQYTSTASINGIRGNVDMSRFVGASKSWPWSTISDGTVATKWSPAAPGAPKAVSASVAGSTSASVTWLPGDSGTAPISGYTVTSSPGHKTATVGGGTTVATVKGLKPGTSYTFTVTAANRVDSGSPSAASDVVTPLYATSVATGAVAAVTPGQAATISATLTGPDGALAGQTVELDRQVSGGWQERAVGTTSEAGKVSFTRHPHRNTTWRVFFRGATPFAGSSTTVFGRVRPTVTASFQTSDLQVGRWAELSGVITPRTAGITVTREVLVGGRWQTTQHKVLTAGAYHFAFRARTAGEEKIRVVASAAGGRSAAHSRPLTLHIASS